MSSVARSHGGFDDTVRRVIVKCMQTRWLSSSDTQRVAVAAAGALVIWDFDGVVADTEPVHASSYRVLLAELGNSTGAFDFSRYVGHPEREIWSMIAGDGYRVPDDLGAVMEERAAIFLREAQSKLGPSRAYRDLSALVQGICREQVLVSNGNPHVIESLLTHWRIRNLRQLYPHQHPTGKLGLLNELWQSGASVTIEDGPVYLKAARAAGSWCIGVRHSLNSRAVLEANLVVSIGDA